MERKTLEGFGIGLLAGAIIGGVIALLYAPKSGNETRKLIKDKTTEVVGAVKEKTTEVVDAIKEETGEVIKKVKETASEVEHKGHVAVKAIKG
jgi:gas vesicle protein